MQDEKAACADTHLGEEPAEPEPLRLKTVQSHPPHPTPQWPLPLADVNKQELELKLPLNINEVQRKDLLNWEVMTDDSNLPKTKDMV